MRDTMNKRKWRRYLHMLWSLLVAVAMVEIVIEVEVVIVVVIAIAVVVVVVVMMEGNERHPTVLKK